MKRITQLGLTLIILLSITSLTVLYGDGWRLRLPETENGERVPQAQLIKTGMLAVRSIPEGAKVYINEEAITATNDTITSLVPKKYTVQVKKDGFETWEKEVEVFPELVTDITAVLVLQGPRLEPLTASGLKAYALSSDNNSIAYITKTVEKPGIWLLSLSGSPINFLKANAREFILDTQTVTPSLGEALWWSPDDSELLVKMNEKGYLLYPVNDLKAGAPTQIINAESVFSRWQQEWDEEFLAQRLELLEKFPEIPESIRSDLEQYDSTWSPDDKKFLYAKPNANDQTKSDIVIVNLESPLPVGEQRISTPLTITDPQKEHISWYSDSYHLIVVREDPQKENYYTVSLIRIDGTNETTLYSGLLASPKAVPTPGGDKIIVQTTLKENSPTNLYGIAIR